MLPHSKIVAFSLAFLVAASAFAQRNQVITLDQAYDLTLASDQSIRIAELEIRKANLLPWSALTKLGPQVYGNSSYNTAHQTSSVTVFGNSGTTRSGDGTDTGTAGFTYQQTLLDLSVFPAWKLGKLSAQVAKLQHAYTVRQTLFLVAQAYYAVLKQQSLVAVDQESVTLAAGQLDLNQKMFNVGQVARTDVLRAEATLEDARRTLIQDQGTLESNRDTLSNILNMGGKTDFTVVEPANELVSDESFDAILQRAYALREDYKASALAIDQDVQRRKEVIAEYAPQVVAGASQDWTGVHDNSYRSNTSAWAATVSVQMPFFTGGQREIDLRTAGYQVTETRLNFEKAGKALESEVKNAWLQAGTLREALKALKAEVVAAEQNYHDLKVQYQAGTATSLDVDSALRDLNTARTQLVGSTYDYQVALRNLLRAEAVFQPRRVENKKVN
jgi:outer membrane protein TolC